jgi:hypothetical protein
MRAIGLLLLLMAAPAAEQRYFEYERPVARDTKVAGQSCVMLDPAVFAHASLGLGDLRLYRGSEETPFALRTRSLEEPAGVSVTPLNLGSRDGRVVFDAAMPEGRYKDLELAVDGQDFLATVTVTGGDAEGGAGTKLGEYTIFDLTGQQLGRSTVLHLPESDFRYLHFVVAGPVEAKSFTGISVGRVPMAMARYVTVAASSSPVEKGRDTVFTFPVERGVAVDRLVVEPGARPAEFSRDVTVAVAAEDKEEDRGDLQGRSGAQGGAGLQGQFSLQGRLLRVHRRVNGRAIDEDRLGMELSAGAGDVARVVTVAIHNESDAPLVLNSVRLEMVERDLCFEAAAGAGYALFYGDAGLEAPRYDYAQLFAAQAHPAMAQLGAETRNAGYVARPDGRPFTERHPWLLWVGMVAVIGVLAGVALRTGKSALFTENGRRH